MVTMVPGGYNRFDSAFRYVYFTSMLPYPYTMHEHFELFSVKRGSLTVTIDGVTVTLEPGDLTLTAPFLFHKNDAAPDAVVEMFSISPHVCPDIAHLFGRRKPKLPYLRKAAVPPLVQELLRTVPAIVTGMTQHRTDGAPGASAYVLDRQECGAIQPYLSVLLLELSKALTLVDSEEHNITAMQKVLQYCTTNFSQEITRRTVSKACSVSLGLISQTFTRLGTSFREYINTLRINRAYQLLTTTEKPITEIIYECGYSNQGTFNRNFQTQFGKSPRDVRHGR